MNRGFASGFINPMLVIGAVLGALACFVRPDYNLPLYMFIYIMRKNPQICEGGEKLKILILMFVTLVVDIIWLLYWAPFYRSDKMRDWEYGIHMFTIVIVIIEVIYKLIMMVILAFVDLDQIKDVNKNLLGRNQTRSDSRR
ncbi:unnamed protein product [Moneuplotes crassus]|uniref:Uncharacterized protein n=1 Tax=Euplotes crassus TaxID=5936 RepID=A0A7S3KFW2_EUPCR|nr:unnamed protein product [Moneuplotes crassus]|mmetsp:Transcript_25451/g.25216  ORF Transcript_25451/g.25216 Transcript_25451/m.25216 type:complete len:141 (+) Transcript_25451:19-441(+)|eukprot:CAMPEP_0196994790 /NCGR_PEP_ID=MMETSP1380-20130617/1026_1 /TAXON_ID=5936 /ORGANISM="Euplotes crassus, Strain CT5" /LENGTH=140 /DNA_ID=CAMNT_0042410255 /DNA_START=16 /DNA_END=438 /DNA_ORIENTATION=-